MANVTKKQLEAQMAELQRINQQLIQQVPEHIREIIKESEDFSDFIKDIENKISSFSSEVSKANKAIENAKDKERPLISYMDNKSKEFEEKVQAHITTLKQKRDDLLASLDNKGTDLDKKHQKHLDNYETSKVELGKFEAFLKQREHVSVEAIRASGIESIEAVNGKLKSSKSEIDTVTEESIKSIDDLTEAFKKLAGEAYYNKSSDKIGDEYRKNAERHKKEETKFQYVGGGSIVGAIIILMIWLVLVICGFVSTELEYYWLPVATITSSLIFLSRWSARIAYRHGLEARRLNQFALDLTAMPAFFAQELLNQGDTEFQNEGKKIVQSKASKMFGNIERFDEQHSHSPMELLWKWVTKRFETLDDQEGLSSLTNSNPITQPKANPQTEEQKPVSPSDK